VQGSATVPTILVVEHVTGAQYRVTVILDAPGSPAVFELHG
jgi:hypothetical protein